jgi:hypothetical protein
MQHTTLRCTMLSKCTCSPPYIDTHTHTPNAAYNSSVYCAFQVYLFPSLHTHNSSVYYAFQVYLFPSLHTHTQLFGILCFPSVLVPLLTHTHTHNSSMYCAHTHTLTTLRCTVLSKCTCSPPYIDTHTHTQNGKDTKLFVVQRPCPCKIRTEKLMKLQIALFRSLVLLPTSHVTTNISTKHYPNYMDWPMRYLLLLQLFAFTKQLRILKP